MAYLKGQNSCNYNGCALGSSTDPRLWFKFIGNTGSTINLVSTSVGSNGGPSAYGTFDQSGNTWELVDASPESDNLYISDQSLLFYRGGEVISQAFDISSGSRARTNARIANGSFRISSIDNPRNYPFFVEVWDLDNAPDSRVSAGSLGFGSVVYFYQISQYPVTTCEYADFLNAVAKTDTYNLYQARSAISTYISRSGTAGNYKYEPITNYSKKPIPYVPYLSILRYCNWLHNGKPVGQQDVFVTENGSYELHGMTTANSRVQKVSEAKYWLSTENEWYKAAFYKGDGRNSGYWNFATQSDIIPSCVIANANGSGPLETQYNCSVVTVTTTTTTPYACSLVVSPYIIIDSTGSNVVVTESSTGSVTTHTANNWTSCDDVYTPKLSKRLGQNGAFTYTLNFSKPINNLVIILTATGNQSNENFIITSPNNNISIIPIKSCFTTINNNVILSGGGSPPSLFTNDEGYGGGGGLFCINASAPFTQITISGAGGNAGSLFALCSRLFSPTTTTTSTTTTTTTLPPDKSYFLLHNSQLYIDSSVIDFNKPNKNYCVRVNLVNPITDQVIQYIDHCVDVNPCLCVTTTTTTTSSTCPPVRNLAVMCSNGVSLSNYPIFGDDGCIIGYQCPETTSTTTSTTIAPFGGLYTWGLNDYGQIGSGIPRFNQINNNYTTSGIITDYIINNPVLVASGSFTDVLCRSGNSNRTTTAINSSGDLYQCGVGYFGEFLDGYEPYPPLPQQPVSFYQLQRKSLTLIKSNYTNTWKKVSGNLALNGSDSLFEDGVSAVKYGTNWPDGAWRDFPKQMLNQPCKKISGKGTHYLIITNSGELFGFGGNNHNQLGTNDKKAQIFPIKLSDKTNWVDVAVGGFLSYNYSLAIDSAGDLYACGANVYYQLGTGDQKPLNTLTKINTNMPPLKNIYAGLGSSFGLTYNNELYFWGGLATAERQKFPTKIPGRLNNQLYNDNWIDVSLDPQSNYALLLNNSGELYQFGKLHHLNQFPTYLTPQKINIPSGVFWIKADVGYSHAAAIGIKS